MQFVIFFSDNIQNNTTTYWSSDLSIAILIIERRRVGFTLSPYKPAKVPTWLLWRLIGRCYSELSLFRKRTFGRRLIDRHDRPSKESTRTHDGDKIKTLSCGAVWRLSSLEKKRKRNHFVTVHRSIVIGHSIRRKRVPISLFRNAILYPIPDRTNAMNYKSSDLQIWSCDRCWSLISSTRLNISIARFFVSHQSLLTAAINDDNSTNNNNYIVQNRDLLWRSCLLSSSSSWVIKLDRKSITAHLCQ